MVCNPKNNNKAKLRISQIGIPTDNIWDVSHSSADVATDKKE